MSSGSEQVNILIVDDESFFAEWLAENLRDTSARYNATWVNSGEHALSYLEQYPVDLVISDIKMEGISGIDLLTRIRSHHPHVGVILMTGYDLPELKQEAIRRGSLFYLEKPFSMERLESTIQEAMSARPPVGHPTPAGAPTGQLTLIDALHFLHLSRSSLTLRVKTPTAEGVIYYQNGEVIHAACGGTSREPVATVEQALDMPGLEGEDAFSQILSWESDNYEVLTERAAPKRSIFRDFESLVGLLARPSPLSGARALPVTAQLSLLDALHLFHLSRSNKTLLIKVPGDEGRITYQNGEIVHAACEGLEGEDAFFKILSWESNDYEVLTDVGRAASPSRSLSTFRDFESLINVVLQPPPSDRRWRIEDREWKMEDGSASNPPSAIRHPPSIITEPGVEPVEEKPGEGVPQLEDEALRRLRDLLTASDHLQGGALITSQGRLLASALPENLLTPTVVSDLSALFHLCHRSVEQLERGPHYQSLIQGEIGNVIVSELTPRSFLVFVTQADAALGLALFQAGEKARNVRIVLGHWSLVIGKKQMTNDK